MRSIFGVIGLTLFTSRSRLWFGDERGAPCGLPFATFESFHVFHLLHAHDQLKRIPIIWKHSLHA